MLKTNDKKILDLNIKQVATRQLRKKILTLENITNRYPGDVNNYTKIIEIAAKYKLATRIINEISQLASKYGIKIIIIKAAYLNGKIYHNTNMRNFTDIDIWVTSESYSKLISIIKEEIEFVSVPELTNSRNSSHEKTLIIQNLPVDIHKHICNPNIMVLHEDKILKEIISNEYNINNLYYLSPIDNIIQLTTHLLNDSHFYHHSLIDIIELMQNEDIQIIEIENRGKELKCEDLVSFLIKALQSVINDKFVAFPKNKPANLLILRLVKILISIKFRGFRATFLTIAEKVVFKGKNK